MGDWYWHVLFTVSRWAHLVCTTLIVGGTLFYELVVPVAIEDLKEEQQLSVFARARWVFRWVVWISAAVLVVTGLVSFYRIYPFYNQVQNLPPEARSPVLGRQWTWALVHMGLGVVSIVIALVLTIGRRPPRHPIGWMRINLVILLVVMFTASIARHIRLALRDIHSNPPPQSAVTD